MVFVSDLFGVTEARFMNLRSDIFYCIIYGFVFKNVLDFARMDVNFVSVGFVL